MKKTIVAIILGMTLMGCQQPTVGETMEIDGKLTVWTPRGQWEKVDQDSLKRSLVIYERMEVKGKTMKELSEMQLDYFRKPR